MRRNGNKNISVFHSLHNEVVKSIKTKIIGYSLNMMHTGDFWKKFWILSNIILCCWRLVQILLLFYVSLIYIMMIFLRFSLRNYSYLYHVTCMGCKWFEINEMNWPIIKRFPIYFIISVIWHVYQTRVIITTD